MTKFVGALDQGTTSTRFMIFDHSGQVVAIHQKEHEQIYPKPGWVEHDPAEIWARCREVITGALDKAGIKASDLAAAGITNQRETAVVWDRKTGKAVYNAIVWQDTRTDTIVNEFAREGGQDRLRDKVGLPLATYFSGPKVKWILDNVDGARAKAEAGDLVFGNIDTWCIWNLTGGVNGGVHVTDVTNASRTMLMNLQTLDWDVEILDCHYPLIHRSDSGPWHFLHGFIQYLNDRLDLDIQPTEFRGDIHLSDEERGWFTRVQSEFGAARPFWLLRFHRISKFTWPE